MFQLSNTSKILLAPNNNKGNRTQLSAESGSMDVKNQGWGREAEGQTGKPKAGGAGRQGKEVSQEEVEGSGTGRSKSI